MTSKFVKQKIFLDISRSIFNQLMKCGQLIEYNFKTFHAHNKGGEVLPRPFLKKSKLIIALDQ